MWEFLFFVLVFGPFLAPCVVLCTAVPLAWRACTRRPVLSGRLPRFTTCVLAAVLGGAGAYGAYSWGVMSGFHVLDPDQMCASKGARGDHVVTRWTLPLSTRCVTSDGAGTELVPDWVNPVIFMGLALLLVALVAGTLAKARGRRAVESGPAARPRPSDAGSPF
ncbi:hypothetical protein [Streptomyces roseolus]|uniref:hypothetical protein n=1 Tax=Streptomyces roseolus TaxID=67358 RepID=UPI00167398DD|nr:hypothetical protein [Streptomyces roseolus]GGR39608.1 hypothetical protein GCM10010282_35320 [Streptomyces roseolus]